MDAHLAKWTLLPFIESGGHCLVWLFINAGRDFVIPIKHLQASLDFVEELTGVYPL